MTEQSSSDKNKTNKPRTEGIDVGENFAKHLHEIHRIFVQYLNPRLKKFYDGLNDFFFDLAEAARNNVQQNQYFAAIGDTRKNNAKLMREFAKNVNIIFQKFKNHDFVYFVELSAQTEHDKKTLTLIKEDDLDQKLAITNVTGKISQIYHEELYLLNERFSDMVSSGEIDNQSNPIGPDAIVNAFALSLSALKSENNIKLIIIKLFEKNMVESLGPVYKLVNKYLKKQGVLPEIKFEVKHNVRQSDQVSNSINYLAQALSETDENYKKIAEILHQDPEQVKAQEPGAQYTPEKIIEFSQLTNALDQIKAELLTDQELETKQTISPLELKDELLRKLKSLKALTGKTKIKQADMRTIDLIGELFQFLVDDRNLPETIQLVLSKLQLPYLQIALKDETFFSDKKNNARQLLNIMAQSSIGWTIETDEKGLFLNKIKEIVGFILKNHEKSINYEKLIMRFLQFEQQIKKRTLIAERRHSEKMSGRERLNKAKVEAAKVLKQALKGQKVPDAVRSLLLKPWANVLVLSELRHKESPKLLKKYQKFVVDLVKATNPESDKKASKLIIDKLCEIMQEGLELVALQELELKKKSKEIRKVLLQTNGLSKTNKHLAYIDPAEILMLSKEFNKQSSVGAFMKTDVDPTVAPEDANQAEDEFHHASLEAKVEDWMEFQTEEGTKRLKISWISPISGKLLFVNGKGGREFDLFRVELAEKFRNGSCRSLQQLPLIDRAMQSIAKKMEEKTGTTEVQ
ncbi:DUF1631 family protein [Marinicella litoralis]|uniref:Uncharacterized protein DUF1631 n=1 Tax=Marinicella litoralis TaxID=644220 RepID=A0A4R6XM74_9GAMM|nr:DUF1631 family protein [Marinicella litoralis]TDR19459.1 uncharacterized protein DUF1631 [Marinicella litoralis]